MGVNFKALITGAATSADRYGQAFFQHKMNDLERKQRLADELAQKRQTGVDEGSYIPAPRVQVGTTTDKLSLLPGMVDPTKTMPSYASTIQPQSTFRLGGEGYMPKPEVSLSDRLAQLKQAGQAGLTDQGVTDKGFSANTPKITAATRNIANPDGLTGDQQIQARALAKKMYGVRGAEAGLPTIYEEMRNGKTIDEIEDSVRYGSQSKEFTGTLRNAAQSVLINTPEVVAQKAMDYIDDLNSKGNTEGAKTQLKRLARTQAGTELSNRIVGEERTIKLLDEIQGDLNNLEAMGVNTNIFTGTAEQIASKVGTVNNPEARKIATKINTAMQQYRRSMTGVAFSANETKEYATMFPGIGRTANFNTANINALKEVFGGDIDNFYSMSMGDNEYQTLFKSGQGKQPQNNKAGNAVKIGRFNVEVQ